MSRAVKQGMNIHKGENEMKKILIALITVLLLATPSYAQHPGAWSNNATLINGASVPSSKTVVGTNSSGQIVDANSATLPNNTSGTAANLSGTPALPNGVTGTTQADNDATTKLATDAFAKSQDAVLAREPNQGVALTAAASGSSGITVADNVNINFNTGNFEFVWKGSLPNWIPGTSYALVTKGFEINILSTTGRIQVYLAGGQYNSFVTVPSLTDGTVHEIAIAGAVGISQTVLSLYIDSVFKETMTLTNSAITSSAVLNILGTTGARNPGICNHVYLLNFAPSSSEILDMYRNGIPEAWKLAAGQAALTSGTLVVGKQYQIDTFVAGDDFVNVGGANVSGTRFISTATTPTTWANSSSIRPAVATLALLPENIGVDQWYDASGNGLNATYPTAGATLTRPVVKPAKQGAVAAKSTSTTVTLAIADLLSTVITGSPTTPATYTFEAGATSDTIGRLNINDAFEWAIVNSGAGAITVTSPGADHTIVGSAIVATLSSARYRTVKTATSTFASYRIN